MMEMSGSIKEDRGVIKEDADNKTKIPEMHKGGEAHIVTLKTKAKDLDDRLDGTVKGGPGPMEDVQ
ncbi:hypothetical protein A2U01_0117955, partial [Trifolium medium]|nr:hypothetical protein [Trifolium medium]